jgi:hypothetical protein
MSKTQPIMDLLDRVAENGAYAPGLWPPEALNGLLMAERRKGLDNKQRRRLAGFLRSLPIKVDTETADQAWTATSKLAERYRLTVYDAAYLSNSRSAVSFRSRRWTMTSSEVAVHWASRCWGDETGSGQAENRRAEDRARSLHFVQDDLFQATPDC